MPLAYKNPKREMKELTPSLSFLYSCQTPAHFLLYFLLLHTWGHAPMERTERLHHLRNIFFFNDLWKCPPAAVESCLLLLSAMSLRFSFFSPSPPLSLSRSVLVWGEFSSATWWSSASQSSTFLFPAVSFLFFFFHRISYPTL